MKRPLSPLFTAGLLVLGSVIFRLAASLFPELVPNISPLLAVALVGGLCLPGRWGWLVGPVSLLITEVAFLPLNARTDSTMISGWTLIALAFYALAGGLGVLIARQPSLARIVAGSVACSLVFYLAANTFSWWHNVVAPVPGLPVYPATLAGWWQANTTGLPGFPPTWLFLRNSLAGDLGFTLLLVFVLDRALLIGRTPIPVPATSR